MIIRVGIDEGDFIGDTHEVIQRAIEAVAAQGGGAVELGPGVYTLFDSVRLQRNVALIGAGRDTVLRKCDGPSSALAIDADYGESKVTVEDGSAFRAGMGVMVTDDDSNTEADSVASVMMVRGEVLYLDRPLHNDYRADTGGVVAGVFSLVSARDVDSVTIRSLTIDGNRAHNPGINGCIGGGIYLYQARNCRVEDCLVRDFNGDGISFQITQDVTIERCEVVGSGGIGIHPGTGATRPLVRDCVARENGSDGLFVCWLVQGGRFENLQLLRNGGDGISIGHKDTDNLFVGNVVQGNERHGICFRNERDTNGASRNTFRQHVIEDNGGCGVYIQGYTTDLLFEDNTIRDTRSGAARTQKVGIWAGEHAARIRAVGNRIENHVENAVVGDVEVSA
jgi:parallel beta-helix repeat protein